MIINVYAHLLMLSLLSEIVYNVLKKGRECLYKVGCRYNPLIWRIKTGTIKFLYFCMPGCYGNRQFQINHVFTAVMSKVVLYVVVNISFKGDLFIQLT